MTQYKISQKQLETDLIRLSVIIRDMEQRNPGTGQAIMPLAKRFQAEIELAKQEQSEFQNILAMANRQDN